jgi:hypothetical protein
MICDSEQLLLAKYVTLLWQSCLDVVFSRCMLKASSLKGHKKKIVNSAKFTILIT